MDSMFAFVNDDKCFCGLDALRTMMQQIRFAMAWSEQQQQSQVLLQQEIIEADGARVGLNRQTSKPLHLKRSRRFPQKSEQVKLVPKAAPKPKAKGKAKAKAKQVVSHGRLLDIKGRFTKKQY